MSADTAKKNSPDLQPERYEFRIQGILDSCWSEWLGCPNMTHMTDETVLSCVIPDQAALHGLLAKIRDMNLKLNSVTRVEFQPDEKEIE